MSWKVSDPMSEKLKLVVLFQSGERSMTSICQELGISRKTGYKLLKRYEGEGPEGLKDRSRAPHHPARQTPGKIQDVVIQARRAHPTWGPRKLKAWVESRNPSLVLPYPSTIGDILKREGLVHPRRHGRMKSVYGSTPRSDAKEPNQQWDADFKGEFRLGNGTYCFPLTVTDNYSRYLLKAHALEGTGGQGARRIFERAFREFGLPQSIRTDNGCPFAGTGLGRLSVLSVWWIKLGILLLRGRPHHPEDNGRHERMHRTLKAEATRPPASTNRGQQKRLDAFREEYNNERPHEALDLKPPARLFKVSARPYPSRVPDLDYPSHYEVRTVGSGGTFSWHSQEIFINNCLRGERVALVEFEDGLWKVYFSNLELGILDLKRMKGRKTGRVLPMSPV